MDTSYSGGEGVREIIDKVNEQGVMTEYRLMEEKKIIKKFMGEVFSNKGLGIYGVKEVTNAVQSGIADIVIVADNVTYLVLESKCKKCEHLDQTVIDRSSSVTTRQQIMAKPCPMCGSTDYDISEKDIVEHLEELTAVTGTRLEVISAQTEEGNQLASLGGIGAILRFKPVSNI
jgi:peptide chain release factor subunit 1